ncbi:MAG: hypothetical protein PHF14_08635, partial [Verrucomicrobiota bacterium]|nr:hypothetical protein [Verrucomicrobiota bacterium]
SMSDYSDDNTARDGGERTGARTVPDHLRRYWLWFLVMAAMVVLVVSSHFVKAYSDPANWLRFAYNLKTEFWTSRWPVGYPFYLFLASCLVGRFYVFWANLPVLLGIMFIAGRVTERLVLWTGGGAAAVWVGLVAMVWPFLFDFWHIVYLTNPYRDPLAIFFCFWAVYVIMGIELASSRPVRSLFLSGVLIGLAGSVKEPSVLMVAPMFFYGLMVWRAKDGMPFWRSVLWFVGGFLLGMSPFLLETYAHTHSILLPPQSFEEGRLLPGMHAHVFGQISEEALKYFFEFGGKSSTIALLFGCVWAVLRRNRVLLALVLPVSVVYFVFYSFYWTFSKRYFFASLVFLAPLVACGTWQICLWLSRIFGVGRHRVRMMALFSGYVVVHALVWGMLQSPIWTGDTSLFSIPKAKRLMAEIGSYVPADGTLLAPRYLYEVVGCLSEIESFPAYQMMSEHLPLGVGLSRLTKEVKTDGSWFVGEVLSDGESDHVTRLIRQLYDLDPLDRIAVEAYSMGVVTGDPQGEVILHRIRPWRGCSVTRWVWTPAMSEAILRLDAGLLMSNGGPRSELKLYFDNLPVPVSRWVDGANYIRVSGPLAQGAHEVRLESDMPLPERIDVVVQPLNRPLLLDFRWNRFPLHGEYLDSNQWRKLPGYDGDYAFSGTGELELPWLWEEGHSVLAFFQVNSSSMEESLPYRIACCSSGSELGGMDVTLGGRGRLLVDLRGADVQQDRMRLQLRMTELGEKPGPGRLELEYVVLIPISAGAAWRTNPGETEGAWFLRSGWHQAERLSPKEPFRWTRGLGRMLVPCPEGLIEPVLRIRLTDRFRPEAAPQSQLRLTWDGVPLDFELNEADYRTGWAWLTAPLPVNAAGSASGLYELGIDSVPWRPSEVQGTKDGRTLGVVVGDILVVSRDAGELAH